MVLELGALAMVAGVLPRAAHAAETDAAPVLDRMAILDTLDRYVWAMDTGDPAGIVATFTVGGVIQDRNGKRWDRAAGGVAGFAERYAGAGRRRGRIHEQQCNAIRRAPGGYLVESYWASVSWAAGAPNPTVDALGTYRDVVVSQDGAWLIGERIIGPWDSATVPVAEL